MDDLHDVGLSSQARNELEIFHLEVDGAHLGRLDLVGISFFGGRNDDFVHLGTSRLKVYFQGKVLFEVHLLASCGITYEAAKKINDRKLIRKLVTKLEEVMNIKNSTDPNTFIEDVLKDFNYYTQNM